MKDIEEIKKQISELQSKVEKLENENKNKNINKRWRAEVGEKYYFLDEIGNIYLDIDGYWEADNYRYKTRNYFKTEEEAQEYADVKLTYYDLMDLAEELNNGEKIDWNNLNQTKYYIYIDYDDKEITQAVHHYYKGIGQIYCLNINFKREAIERIGEERLKKLFTYERS